MLEPFDDADEYTQARTETDIAIVSEDAFAPLGDAIVHLGAVEVRNQVVAYQRKQISTNTRDRGAASSTCPSASLVDARVLVHGARRRRRGGRASTPRSSSARCTRPSTA